MISLPCVLIWCVCLLFYSVFVVAWSVLRDTLITSLPGSWERTVSENCRVLFFASEPIERTDFKRGDCADRSVQCRACVGPQHAVALSCCFWPGIFFLPGVSSPPSVVISASSGINSA